MTQTSRSTQTEAPSLAEQTAQVRDEFIAALPVDQQQIIGAAFEKLLASSVGDSAIKAGDDAPDFFLPSARGGKVRLSDLVQSGPVVLNFYRGGWCPFCNLEFRALQQRLPEIGSLGATLIGVSPETPDSGLTTIEKHQLEFEVLSDEGNKVAGRYGLIMQVFEELRPLYLQWGLDIPACNGDDSWELPLPATYVIDGDGRVRCSYINKDYTQRMEPDELIEALRTINQE